ncbi:hypothetical protein CJ20_180 [Escherichia phage CJ20]|nr:hypothetical protein CJ20_180 [Escherichia phage CJ20]
MTSNYRTNRKFCTKCNIINCTLDCWIEYTIICLVSRRATDIAVTRYSSGISSCIIKLEVTSMAGYYTRLFICQRSHYAILTQR